MGLWTRVLGAVVNLFMNKPTGPWQPTILNYVCAVGLDRCPPTPAYKLALAGTPARPNKLTLKLLVDPIQVYQSLRTCMMLSLYFGAMVFGSG